MMVVVSHGRVEQDWLSWRIVRVVGDRRWRNEWALLEDTQAGRRVERHGWRGDLALQQWTLQELILIGVCIGKGNPETASRPLCFSFS